MNGYPVFRRADERPSIAAPPSPVFDRAVAPYGGTLDMAAIPCPERGGINEIVSVFRGTIDSLSHNDVPLSICDNTEVGVIDNVDFNAVALQKEGVNCIGIYLGLILGVYRLFMGLFASPRFMPNIGCPSEEDLPDRSLGLLLAGDIADEWRAPNDFVRLDAARNFAFNACMYVFLHELTHVARGHLDLLKTAHGVTEHLEYSSCPLPQDRAFLMRVLELDADGFASLHSMAKWHYAVTSGMFPAIGGLRPEWTWATGVNVFFRLLDRRSLQLPDLASRTHPGPGVRWVGAVLNLLGEWPAPSGFLKDDFSELTIAADREVRTLWRELAVPHPAFESLYRSMEDSQNELLSYVQELRALDSTLTDMARRTRMA